MKFRDYVYVSDRKINQMYSQMTSGRMGDVEVKGEATIGVAKAGITVKSRGTPDSIQKLRQVIDRLRSNGLIGTITSQSEYFEGQIRAHCLLLGAKVFFLGHEPISGSVASSDPWKPASAAAFVGLSCSLEHMIGGGYDGTEDLHLLSEPRGRAKGYGVKWTSSNVGFAGALLASDNIENRQAKLDELRRDWQEKFALSDSNLAALCRYEFLNSVIEVLHDDMFSFEIKIFRDDWPPQEPKPHLTSRKLYRPLTWLLGQELYKSKIDALNKRKQLAKAVARTGIDPFRIEVLREIRRYASDRRPPVSTRYSPEFMIEQTYDIVAVRLLDGEIDGDRVILGSPLFIGL